MGSAKLHVVVTYIAIHRGACGGLAGSAIVQSGIHVWRHHICVTIARTIIMSASHFDCECEDWVDGELVVFWSCVALS